MDQLRDFADPRLIDGCVFCHFGEGELTRDHVPSRVLLDPPLPSELPIVYACERCNKGFSLDEEYVACWLDCVVAGSTDPDQMPREVVRKILRHKPTLRERIERSRQIIDDRVYFMPEKARVDNVVRKLARGHAAFELSTPLRREPDRLRWWSLPSMDERQLEEFDAAHVHHLVGEVGSRATQRMMVVQTMLRAPTGELVTAPLLVSNWVEVQEGRYRYLAVDDAGGSWIKMVIGEYLACEVIWSWEHEQEDEHAASRAESRGDQDAQLMLLPKHER